MTGNACPICDGATFRVVNGRPTGACASCGAKERTRLLGLFFKKLPPRAIGLPVYHFAPERSLSKMLARLYGPLYVPADFVPGDYANIGMPVQKIDLSRIKEHFAPNSLGGVVHSHVLEHLPCSVDRAIHELNDVIAPGGFHVFQAPVEIGWFREDMDPTLPKEERVRRFGKDDHFRVFGREDFEERVLRHFADLESIPMREHISPPELTSAGVPAKALRMHTSHSLYAFIKR